MVVWLWDDGVGCQQREKVRREKRKPDRGGGSLYFNGGISRIISKDLWEQIIALAITKRGVIGDL